MSRLGCLVLVLLAGCFSGGRRLPAAELSEPMALLYNGYAREDVQCWRCHDGTGRGTEKGPSLLVRVPRRTRAQLIATVTRGARRMPDFGEVLEPEELAALVDWVRKSFRPPE